MVKPEILGADVAQRELLAIAQQKERVDLCARAEPEMAGHMQQLKRPLTYVPQPCSAERLVQMHRGSKLRSVGPVYRELARQAETLRQDYLAAQAQLADLNVKQSQAIEQFRAAPQVVEKAGLLARIEALHQYTSSNTAAFVAWCLFFALVLFFELMVVLSKLVFGETVDDELDRIREHISQQKARDYMQAVTSPVMGARQLIEASYS